MARVGRASRNASLMRVETVTTATKVCAAAESGEIYLIDRAAGCTLTLPPLKAGAYVKIIVADEMTSGNLVVKGATTTDYMVGCVPVRAADAGHDGTISVVAAKGTTKDELTVTDGAGIHEGSWIELVSDGSVWFLTGLIIGSDETTTAVVS